MFDFLIIISFALLLLTSELNAQMQKIFILKEIDDDNIIIVTEKNEKYLLEKWTMRLSPVVFEGKMFEADVTPLWVTIYFENRDPIKWSIEKYLGDYSDSPSFANKKGQQKDIQSYSGLKSKHWISKVLDNGKLIQLEDNSVWEVSPIDVIYSALWLPITNVYVKENENPNYNYNIINTDNGKIIGAKLISK